MFTRRTITVPEDWNGRDIYLHIAGAKSGCYVYLNGKEVGYNEDSKNPAEYLVNDWLKPGENVLTLKISAGVRDLTWNVRTSGA